MTEEKKHFDEIDEMEELSLLLDELNSGRKPDCENPETAELLAVADLLKKEGGPVCPPQHILDQTVDRALAGIQAGKQKPSRAWWYSGALGTAAAVILVFGLNLLPSWQEQIPVPPPPSAVSQQPNTLQPKPDNEQPPTVSPAAPTEKSTSADSAPAARQQAPTDEQKKSPPVAKTPPIEPVKPPTTTNEKSILAEQAPRTSQSKSVYLPPAAFPEAAQSPQPAITPLTIPGQKPDLLVIDRENGTVRQVYHKGTPQEITITQRLRPRDSGDAQIKAQSPAALQAREDNEAVVNTVQVKIAGQEVTIEGRQSRQELLNLAESLTP